MFELIIKIALVLLTLYLIVMIIPFVIRDVKKIFSKKSPNDNLNDVRDIVSQMKL